MRAAHNVWGRIRSTFPIISILLKNPTFCLIFRLIFLFYLYYVEQSRKMCLSTLTLITTILTALNGIYLKREFIEPIDQDPTQTLFWNELSRLLLHAEYESEVSFSHFWKKTHEFGEWDLWLLDWMGIVWLTLTRPPSFFPRTILCQKVYLIEIYVW